MGAAFTIMGFNPKQRCIAFTELQSKLNRSKVYSPYPIRYHQSPHVCSHILRGGTSLLSPSGTTDLDTVPDAEESKPEGRLTHRHRLGGRACRKLGGAGEISGQVYDYRTSQEGTVSGQELDHGREGTLYGPSGKCPRIFHDR